VRPDQIETLARAGFDYCELQARAVLPFEDEAAALPELRALEAAPLRAEAFNVLVPAELPLVGPSADFAALRLYVQRAFKRMAQIGGAVVVLGSGRARRIPDDMPRAQALDQLADALRLMADEAQQAGLELALEHLHHGECNVFNSLAECQAFIRDHGLNKLQLLADLHHLEVEHESFSSVINAAPQLAHVHVADGGRRHPGSGGYDYAGFMFTLHTIGYDRRISAECAWDDLETQAAGALAFMREQWGVASQSG
jgi:D-psicose/D-tagatose/L-ribulose 3-epimerase